jgi:hypothetical protein
VKSAVLGHLTVFRPAPSSDELADSSSALHGSLFATRLDDPPESPSRV